jgi:dolichol-phosphate mannosyltransferase
MFHHEPDAAGEQQQNSDPSEHVSRDAAGAGHVRIVTAVLPCRVRELAVMLPCYNEEAALPELLARLNSMSMELGDGWSMRTIVVDDGSTDRSRVIAQAAGVGLIPLLINQGLGAAVQYCISGANEARVELFAIMDADGTHPPELLQRMLAKLEAEQLDVVIASRFAPGGGEHGLPPLRKLYTSLASMAMRTLAPVQGVQDYSCGYRLYRMSAVLRAADKFGGQLVTEQGFVCMVELLIKLARSGARIGEVGLDLHYELKQGPSKMNVGSTIQRYARFALRARFDPKLR